MTLYDIVQITDSIDLDGVGIDISSIMASPSSSESPSSCVSSPSVSSEYELSGIVCHTGTTESVCTAVNHMLMMKSANDSDVDVCLCVFMALGSLYVLREVHALMEMR